MITLIPKKVVRAKAHTWLELGSSKKSKKGATCKVYAVYCANCGLVRLKNKATQKAIKAPCPGMIDVY